MGLDQVLIYRESVRGSKAFRHMKLPHISINRDDRLRLGKTCALDSRESDRTASDDGNAAARLNPCYIADRSNPGRYSTTDQTGNVERHALRDPDSAVFSDNCQFRKSAGVHQLMNGLFAVENPRLTVKVHRTDPIRSILLAQYELLMGTEIAMPAMRIPGKSDMITH
jgi:hypothetical protein